MRLVAKQKGELCMEHFSTISEQHAPVVNHTYPIFYNPSTGKYVNDEDIFYITHAVTNTVAGSNRLLSSYELSNDLSVSVEKMLTNKMEEKNIQGELAALVKRFKCI